MTAKKDADTDEIVQAIDGRIEALLGYVTATYRSGVNGRRGADQRVHHLPPVFGCPLRKEITGVKTGRATHKVYYDYRSPARALAANMSTVAALGAAVTRGHQTSWRRYRDVIKKPTAGSLARKWMFPHRTRRRSKPRWKQPRGPSVRAARRTR